MNKALFFDIDGTLLDHGAELDPDLKIEINRLKEMGYLISIATGRDYTNAIDIANELGIENIICSNGINIYYKNKEIKELVFTKDEFKRLQDLVCPHSDYIGYVSKKGVFVIDTDEHIRKNFSGYGNIKLTFVDNIDDVEVQKISINTPNKDELDAIIENLTDEFVYYRWSDNQCEIQLATQSKAKGIEVLLNEVDEEMETYAFGDGVNDIEMMEYVDHAIVMGNAYDSVKEHAEVVIGDIKDDGLIKYLKENF